MNVDASDDGSNAAGGTSAGAQQPSVSASGGGLPESQASSPVQTLDLYTLERESVDDDRPSSVKYVQHAIRWAVADPLPVLASTSDSPRKSDKKGNEPKESIDKEAESIYTQRRILTQGAGRRPTGTERIWRFSWNRSTRRLVRRPRRLASVVRSCNQKVVSPRFIRNFIQVPLLFGLLVPHVALPESGQPSPDVAEQIQRIQAQMLEMEERHQREMDALRALIGELAEQEIQKAATTDDSLDDRSLASRR